MALWGKGDPRWIVEERPDSKNVNNWHWTERDATNWSKDKLKSLFLGVKHESEEGDSWFIEEVKTCDGEATINNRKGKLIYFYEWNIVLKYKGKIVGSELNHIGTITIPNLSDENSAADVDVEVTITGDSKNADKVKQLVRKTGIPACKNICGEYLSAMRTEYSTGMVLPTKDNGAPNTSNVKSNTNPNNTSKMNENMKDLNVKEKKTAKNTSCHLSITLKEEFRTTADELYMTLTQPERLSAFTGSQCQSKPEVNGTFSIMNDNISGSYTELIPNKKIGQKWRFKEWPEDMYSTVVIELDQKEDLTILKLSQTGVPDYDTSRTEQGWKRHFWGPMKQVFGYGAQLF